MAQYRITFPGSMTRNGEPATFETHENVHPETARQMQSWDDDITIERMNNND